METFYWNTELPLATNTDTMNDFLENYLESHCGSDYKIIEQDGTYAEIENSEGTTYGVHAIGNGDFCTDKVEMPKPSENNRYFSEPLMLLVGNITKEKT